MFRFKIAVVSDEAMEKKFAETKLYHMYTFPDRPDPEKKEVREADEELRGLLALIPDLPDEEFLAGDQLSDSAPVLLSFFEDDNSESSSVFPESRQVPATAPK